MKKIGKFLATTFSLVAILGGAFYFYENFMKKSDDSDLNDFDDFDDSDDFDNSDEESSSNGSKSNRGYTTLNVNAQKTNEEADQEEHENVEVFDLNEDEQ